MNAFASSTTTLEHSREDLVAKHLAMARRIALRVARRVPDCHNQDDLVSAAMVGLAEAADRFSGQPDDSFIAFAEKRIRGAVLDELRRGDIMPRRVRTTARKVSTTIRTLEHQLGRNPETGEVAAVMGVSLEEYRRNMAMLTRVSVVELTPQEEQSLMASEDTSPAALAEKASLRERLKECLGRLKERDALILTLYYVEELNYMQIGEVLGVSESRVCQLHARALAKLRAEFEAEQ